VLPRDERERNERLALASRDNDAVLITPIRYRPRFGRGTRPFARSGTRTTDRETDLARAAPTRSNVLRFRSVDSPGDSPRIFSSPALTRFGTLYRSRTLDVISSKITSSYTRILGSAINRYFEKRNFARTRCRDATLEMRRKTRSSFIPHALTFIFSHAAECVSIR